MSLGKLEQLLGGEFDKSMNDETAKKIVEETFMRIKRVLALNDMNLTDCFVDASSDGQSFKLDRNGLENALASIYRGFAASAFPEASSLKASQFQQPRTGESIEKHTEEHKQRLDAFLHQYDRLKTGSVDAD